MKYVNTILFVFCNVFKQLRPNNWITFLPPLKRLKTTDLIEQFNSSHGFLIISLKRLRLSRTKTRPVIIILRIGTIQVKYMLLTSTYPGIFYFGSNYQSLTPKQWTFPRSKVSACMCGFGEKWCRLFQLWQYSRTVCAQNNTSHSRMDSRKHQHIVWGR